jgi:aspartate carbamoyltransferase catalytic subunit
MSKYMTQSKVTQMSAMQQGHKASHPGPTATTMPTHKDIAKRAHEIYVEKACRQGQSEQNWLQAEQELKNQENWLQAEQE